MPTCRDCLYYEPKNETTGTCTINGPTEGDRESGRCPSRTFRPKN